MNKLTNILNVSLVALSFGGVANATSYTEFVEVNDGKNLLCPVNSTCQFAGAPVAGGITIPNSVWWTDFLTHTANVYHYNSDTSYNRSLLST